jgi:propionyl-CoA carboxylase alpha subunit
MFDKILIANRGEIACRIIHSARRLDCRVVVVYSDADRDAVHVKMADEAIHIGPAPASESYLSIDNVVEAIRKSGADAVHPGYGFLSENPVFARAVRATKATFIGPDPDTLTTMGDKIAAKKIAEQAGVNVIPGHAAPLSDSQEAVTVAREVGYPVMLKAAAGGGGKGMRVAHNDAEAAEGFDRARSEARSSFGDDRIFCEKYIEEPRHIEIQILADGHGNAIWLGERECSLQRRHQKVIEEAPSPFVDEALRQAMGQQAVDLARAVRYVTAGTVEFIVDTDGHFYFLEMNTRLQVEHPVTELVTGVDIVEQMIRTAAGEPLSLTQDHVKIDGWALEARVYAENPLSGFVPSSGRLDRYLPPEETPLVRVDMGVGEGDEITLHYDPMIAKVCTWGETRDDAIETMGQALDEFYISGIKHNIAFLTNLITHPRFKEGRLSTAFIDQEYPDGFQPNHIKRDDPHLLTAISAAIHQQLVERAAQVSGRISGPVSGPVSGPITCTPAPVNRNWIVLVDEEQHAVRVTPGADLNQGQGPDLGLCYNVILHGEAFTVRSKWSPGSPLFTGAVNGQRITVQIDIDGVGYRISHAGAVARCLVLRPSVAKLYSLMPVKRAPDLSLYLLSPMPGLLLSLLVAEGDQVRAGQMLAIVEAMKMENVLRATQDGVVAKLRAHPGDTLSADQIILEFAETPP